MNSNAACPPPSLAQVDAGKVDPVALLAAEVEDQVRCRGRALARVMVDEPVGAAPPDQHVRADVPVQPVGPVVTGEPVVVKRAREVLDAEQQVVAAAVGGAADEVDHHARGGAFEAGGVDPGAALEHVVAARATVDRVVAVAAVEPIVAGTAVDQIVPASAVDSVIAPVAEEQVIAALAAEDVDLIVASEAVVERRADHALDQVELIAGGVPARENESCPG